MNYFENILTINTPIFNNGIYWWIVFGMDLSDFANGIAIEQSTVGTPNFGSFAGAATAIFIRDTNSTLSAYLFPVRFLVPPQSFLISGVLNPVGFQAFEGTFEEVSKFL